MTTVTVLYPALHSIRAIESEDDKDDKIWLSYWMIFGIFNVLETFFGFIFWIIPYWSWVRLGFFIWLLLPQFNGSLVVYESVFRPLLKANQDLIKHYADLATKSVSNAGETLKSQAASAAADAMKDPSVIAAATTGLAQAQMAAASAATSKTPAEGEVVEADNTTQ